MNTNNPTNDCPSGDELSDMWGEIHDLVTRYTFGDATDEDIARLDRWLCANEDARRIYVEHVVETTSIASLLQPVAVAEPAEALLATALATNAKNEIAKVPRRYSRVAMGCLGDAMRFFQARTALSSSLAAALTIFLLGAFGFLRYPGERTSVTTTAPRSPIVAEEPRVEQTLAATITGLVDCRWAADLSVPGYGEPIFPGRIIDIREGLAQLSFESGAKMILQGPALFTVNSEKGGTLDCGKLTALVPEQATGFKVRTPSAEVIDLGTEFGVQVNDEGETEVHVLQGEVVTWGLDESGNVEGTGIHVNEHDSISFTWGAIDSVEGKADQARFVREIAPRLSGDELPMLPVQNDLVLWLAADILVSTDANNRVIAWQDILAGDNQTDESAWQHEIENRPTLMADAIGGKPAIRFDGASSFLVTTPMATTDNQTIFIVFQRNAEPTRPRQFRQLINYNGPPFRVPDYGLGSGILQIDDGIEPHLNLPQPGAYRAMVHAGVTAERIVNTGYVRSRRIEVGTPAVLTYVYNRSANRAELLINGDSQGETTAPTSIAMNTRKAIGRHPQRPAFFEGDMAELLIYNDGLEAAEIERVTRHLVDKYGLQTNSLK